MLTGRTVLIGGGEPSLRQHFAARCKALGARPVVAARAGEDATSDEDVVVWNETDADDLTAALAQRQCQIDALITLPSAVAAAPLDGFADVDWAAALAANLRLRYLVTRAVTPGLVRRRSGALVHVIGAEGMVGARADAAVSTLGHAVIGLARSTALDLAEDMVRCNCVAATSLDEAAEASCFLISAAAAGFNGQVLLSDGARLHLAASPRPLRILHRNGGWKAEDLADALARPWAGAFVPCETLEELL